MAANNERFQFHSVPQRDVFASIRSKSKEQAELFEKWGMQPHMRFDVFSYNKLFKIYQMEAFVQDFFKSEVINSHLQTLSSSGKWSPLRLGDSITGVTVEEVPCSVMNMDFFDRLTTEGIVKPSGQISKCFDEVVDEFLVSDELRKMLIMEDSDHYHLFTAEERREFIFQILLHLSLGGPVNQYEDDIGPYLATVKMLYKELVLVVRDSNTKRLSIASTVLKVQAKVGDDVVFPCHAHHQQSFCYLIIDNAKRHVITWYHIWQ